MQSETLWNPANLREGAINAHKLALRNKMNVRKHGCGEQVTDAHGATYRCVDHKLGTHRYRILPRPE